MTSRTEILYKCESCEFTSPDEALVIEHLNTHQGSLATNFYNDAYAVSMCENSPSTSAVSQPLQVLEANEHSDDPHNESTFSNRDEETESYVTWGPSATKLLIEVYNRKKPLVEAGKIKTLKRMWLQIHEEIQKFGYSFSLQQLENKWKSLERSYKNVVENKKKTGRGRKTCPYEKELGEILAKRHSIEPICIIATLPNADRPSTSRVENLDESHSSTIDTPRAATANNRCRTTSIVQQLAELHKLIEEKGRAREKLEERKIQQRAEILEQLKKKNELLEKFLDKL